MTFSQHLACPVCGYSMEELAPRNFSFNSPYGACPHCVGLGTRYEVDPDLVVPDHDMAIDQGAIAPWSGARGEYFHRVLAAVADTYGFKTTTPFGKLKKADQKVLLYGSGTKQVHVQYRNRYGRTRSYHTHYEGVVTVPAAPAQRGRVRSHARADRGLHAGGAVPRLRRRPAQARVARGHGRRAQPVRGVRPVDPQGGRTLLASLELSERDRMIAEQVMKEVNARLRFLLDVGLDYLSLNRSAATLAGGEAQRIRLASQIGSGLVGVLYVLDEPSIGLHQRDNRTPARHAHPPARPRQHGDRRRARRGHDPHADHVVDIGPGAGRARRRGRRLRHGREAAQEPSGR